MEALYTAGYGIRAAFKARTGSAFIVGPLEGLWSSDGPASFVARDKGRWDWTMLIPLPDQITSEDATAGLQTAARKAPDLPVPGVRRLTEVDACRSCTSEAMTTRGRSWPVSTPR